MRIRGVRGRGWKRGEFSWGWFDDDRGRVLMSLMMPLDEYVVGDRLPAFIGLMLRFGSVEIDWATE